MYENRREIMQDVFLTYLPADKFKTSRLTLNLITGLRRVSKPGLRIYSNCEDMPKVMKGLGVAIVSTSKGVMTDKAARAAHVGGEVLAFVW